MADDTKALVPIDQKNVVFYGDTLIAVLVKVEYQKEPQIYVPVKPIADALGLEWSGQYQRINRDEVLTHESRLVRITEDDPKRGRPEQLCLPLEFIPGWLFGVQTSRVKPELREKVMLFRRECYRVLHEAFQQGKLTTGPAFSELLQTDSPAVQAYHLAMAVADLARSQVLMEARLGGRLEDVERRLEGVETILGDPGRHVTPEQASQISQAVKAVALTLSRQSGRNEYGGVYGELYRRFEITSYKQLPARRFQEALDFLTHWHQSLVGSTPFDGPDPP